MEKISGGSCIYLGQRYPLFIQIDRAQKKPLITFDGTEFLYTTAREEEAALTSALQSFYKRASRKIIEERLRMYQPQIRIKYRSFKINDRVKQWGSCSSDRHLTFHWRLILYPIEAIDYVVVHELCHLKHMNHDRSFWRLLGKLYPEYKNAMAILQGQSTQY
ncbi:hypothetical protein SANA_15130 [Gottschalkiaceae bacterium SANA]|nr:hypothetical protein SANA_15130 [Gottschalkiaceae bacterium SANA]